MIQEIIYTYNNKESLYGNKLTNHLNMGLYALYKLGASESQLHEFAKGYIEHNHLPDVQTVKADIGDENFADYLGIDGYYSSFIPFFKKKLEAESVDRVIKFYLNRFIDGSAGGAFHGIIRLAYAYELSSEDEIAKALAYMAESYKAFPRSEAVLNSPLSEPISAVLALANNTHFINKEFQRELIIGRMEDIYEDPEFEKCVSQINKSYCNSKYFSELLLKLYALTEDFTMLHGFTSTHALRVLEPLITNYEEVLELHWYHLQLAYLSTKCTKINDVPFVENLKSWEDIFKDVIKVKDIHTIKIVYSLYEQSRYSSVPDSLSRTMAQKKIESSY